jgi:hypothetical protein
MKSVRNIVSLLLAMVVFAFALPSVGAPQKDSKFSVSLAPSSSPLTLTATITNLGGSSNTATISSFKLTFAGAKIDLNGTTGTSGKISLADGDTSVVVTKIVSLTQGGPSYVLTIKLKDCGDGISLASATAWTGSQQTGNKFVLATTVPLSAPSVSCGNFACGTPGQTVPTSQAGADIIFVERDSFDKNGDTVGVCETIPFFLTTIGDQQHLNWPVGNGPNNDPHAAFQLTVTSDIPSGGLPTGAYVAWFNEDGTSASQPGDPDFIEGLPCNPHANFVPTPYGRLTADVSPFDPSITVDTTGATPRPAISFPATITAITLGSPTTLTAAAHGYNDGDSITFNSGFTGLDAGLLNGQTFVVQNTTTDTFDVLVDTTSADIAPSTATSTGSFDIVIGGGAETPERMTATYSSGSANAEVWNVVRAVAFTAPAGGTLHSATAPLGLAMSTPLPIMTSTQGVVNEYVTGHQAQMCIKKFPTDNGDDTYDTIYIDIGDGWVAPKI